MTPERWEQVRELLHDAMQLRAENRPAFLDSHCSDDPSLRQDLECLLAANAEVRASFLEPTGVARVASELICSSHDSVLPQGTRLGPYVVLGLIGAGGMGEVYRARDERLDRTVAIKVIPALFSSDPQRRQRLQREARAISAVQHPNICALFDIGQQDGLDYLVMELLEGQPLGERIRPKGLPLELLLRYGVEIADALDAAHQRGIIHRDLKPGNIFLTLHGECKVLDFGLAQMESRPFKVATTVAGPEIISTPGVAMGTAPYMSPEQARGETLDSRTDIFSLGAALYEMATGQMAFPGKTSAVIFKAILDLTPPAPTEVNESLPGRLDEVIGKCLEKDRDLRYQSAADLRTDLKRIQRDSGPQHINTVGESDRLFTARRSRSMRLILATVLALIVLAGGAVYYWRTQPLAKTAFQNYQLTALTSTGNVAFATLSPDGRYLAYGDDEIGRQSLWVQQLATSTTLRVLGPVLSYLGRGVRFSPDGNYLYYSQREADGSKFNLYRLTVLGGTPERILTDLWTNDSSYTGAVEFSPDGKQIVFARYTDKENYLLIANANGSNGRRLLTLPAKEQMRVFAWAPDGQTIAFGIDEAGAGNMNCIAVISSAGGKERRILRTVFGIGGMAWLPDQSGLVISGVPQGSEDLAIWIVSYPDGRLRRVSKDLAGYWGVSLAEGSKRLETVQKQMDSSLWVASTLNLSQTTQLREGAGKKDGMRGVAWLADGRLVYGSGNLKSELWLVDRDGGHRQQLTHTNREAQEPSVSLGATIIFSDNGIWTISADSSNLKQITNASAGAWSPEMSPDGKWITYVTIEGPWKMSLDGGQPTKLDPNGDYPTISPDGRWIAFEVWKGNKRNKIEIVASDGNLPPRFLPFISEPQVPESTNMGSLPIRWTANGDAITYVRTKDGVSNLWSQPINGGPAKQLTNFTSMLIWRHTWSRDGKYLVLARGNFSRDAVLLTDLR